MEELATQFTHIKGWAIDADPRNEPTYPIKKYNGDDHKRSNYIKPPKQPETVEVLHSNERPGLSSVYGTSVPPSGLSGSLRRLAFHYSENRLRHWLPLILADRVNVMEGIIEDLAHGHIPNIYAECGWGAELKYNRQGVIKKVVIGVAVASLACALVYRRSNARRRMSAER